MRQLTYHEVGRVDWEDVPRPTIDGDGEALVRPIAVATCDLDTAIVRGGVFGGPLPLGHECVAEVVEVGGSVGGVSPGRLVSVPFQISCGRCSRCAIGQTAHCESVPSQSAYGLPPRAAQWGGFLSDLVRVPYAEQMLVPLPDGVDPAAAASVSDNIVDAWRTVAPHLAEDPGPRCWWWAGAVPGASASMRARSRSRWAHPGSSTWTPTSAASRSRGRWAPRRSPDCPTSASGRFRSPSTHPPTRRDWPSPSAPPASDGVCTSTGIYFTNDTPLPMFEAYVSGITFRTGRVHARPAMPAALELIAAGRFHPELVTTRCAGWEEAPEALAEGEFVKLVFVREAGTAAVDQA